MRTFKVKLHEVTETGTVREVPGFAIDAEGHDDAKPMVLKRLRDDFGYKVVRGVSFTTDGHMAAYVVAKEGT